MKTKTKALSPAAKIAAAEAKIAAAEAKIAAAEAKIAAAYAEIDAQWPRAAYADLAAKIDGCYDEADLAEEAELAEIEAKIEAKIAART